jgi:hypothetical protein
VSKLAPSRHTRFSLPNGRQFLLVPTQDVENWTRDQAIVRLREATAESPPRQDLARLADDLFCPSQDPQRVMDFLAERFDRGDLVALRVSNPSAGLPIVEVPREPEIAWDDIPYLHDLLPRQPDPDAGAASPSRQPAEAETPEDDATRPTWIELAVVGESGLVVEGARVMVRLPDGETQTHSLGPTGKIRIDPIPKPGACDVWLDVPIMLSAPTEPPGELPLFDALIAHDRPTAVSLATGRLHRVAVTRPTARIVELSDLGFESDGRILRPDAREGGDGTPGSGGLGGVAAALALALADPTLRMGVMGHADTVGSTADNELLSLARADNVQLFVAGRRDEWAAHCQAHYTVGDFEAAYRFVARTFGWECDPGHVDDDFDAASRGARDRFRERYTAETGIMLERHVKQNPADWAALFDLYRRALAQAMGLEIDELAERCAAIQFVEPASVGCGERFPKEAPDRDGFACAGNRRVDIVLVHAPDLPYLGTPVDVERVYGARRVFRRIGIHVPRGGEALGEFVSQLVDELDQPVPNRRYELTLPDGTMIEGRLDAQGFVRVTGVPVGVCKLVYPDLDAREWGATPIGPRPLPVRGPEAAGAPWVDFDDLDDDGPHDDDRHQHGVDDEDWDDGEGD